MHSVTCFYHALGCSLAPSSRATDTIHTDVMAAFAHAKDAHHSRQKEGGDMVDRQEFST